MVDVIFATIEKEGQRNELAEFYKKNKNRLFRIAFSKLHNRESAEDAVMETFAQIADKPDRFFAVPQEQRTAYVSVIARNIACKMFGENCPESINEHEDKAELNDPENMFFDNESALELINTIRSLPDGKKDVLILKIIHNKSSAEIAQILNIPEATVRKRLSDARILIRKYIKENNDV